MTIIYPSKQYRMSELLAWWNFSKSFGQELTINPINPEAPKLLQCSMTITCDDDIASLTQWLGGLPA